MTLLEVSLNPLNTVYQWKKWKILNITASHNVGKNFHTAGDKYLDLIVLIFLSIINHSWLMVNLTLTLTLLVDKCVKY